MRGADDFLFMSTDSRRTEQFLALISSGFPKYNCVFKHEKTTTNLPRKDVQSGIATADGECDEFVYCGAKINVRER